MKLRSYTSENSILFFFMHIYSVSILSQILAYSTFISFSITLFKKDYKLFRNVIHFEIHSLALKDFIISLRQR